MMIQSYLHVQRSNLDGDTANNIMIELKLRFKGHNAC